MSFVRIVERLLIAPRGSKPIVVERLQCGHQHSFLVPREWVDREEFPPKTKNCRERKCSYCARKVEQTTTYLGANPHEVRQAVFAEDIVLQESYDLLSDIAKAFADAEAKDLEKNGPDAVDGGGGGGVG